MTSKIARNAPCPCGSGKKYKFCHGNPADSGEAGVRAVEMQYRFDSIILSPETEGGEPRIVVNGELAGDGEHFPFLMIVRPLPEGGMQIQQFGWRRIPPIADKDAVARQLLRYLGECLELLPLKAHAGAEDPAQIEWRPVASAEEAASAHCVFLRPKLAHLPAPDWPTMWDRISLKLRGDPACRVTGFSTEEVEKAFARLQAVFTPQWLERTFNAALGGATPAGMSAEFPHEASRAWFPAFHLSRLASGVICRDPALNALVDLGLALDELEGFTGADELKSALADDTALHHQACLAAELFHRGCLSAFEGGGQGDLKVILDDQPYLLRSVEVRQSSLMDDLLAHLQERDEQLPVILHAVICESSWHGPEQDLALDPERLQLPAGVHALVVGNRFLDNEGGRLKRSARTIIYNERGVDMPKGRDVERLFAPNHESWSEPALNVGSYFYVL